MAVHFRTGILRVTLEAVFHDYRRYRGLVDKPDDGRGRETAEEVDLDTLAEKDVLWW